MRKIAKIVEFVEESRDKAIAENPKFKNSLTYRWEHTLRVAQYGKKLAKMEKANEEIVIAACLLHDIAKLSDTGHGLEHGRAGAKLARPFLLDLGYVTAEVEHICFAIARHVDGKADFAHPITIEAHLVSDADKIDRFSGYRIWKRLGKETEKEYDVFIRSVKNQLKRFDEQMPLVFLGSQSGRQLFDEQISLQKTYLERLIADHQLTTLDFRL